MDGASIGKPTEGWSAYSSINDREVKRFAFVGYVEYISVGEEEVESLTFVVGANREWIVEYDSKGKEVARYNVDHISEIRWAKEK